VKAWPIDPLNLGDFKLEVSEKLPQATKGIPNGLTLSQYFTWMADYGDPLKFAREYQKFRSYLVETIAFGAKTVSCCGTSIATALTQAERQGMIVNSWPPSTQSLIRNTVSIQTDVKIHARYRSMIALGLTPEMARNYVPMMQEVTRDFFEHELKSSSNGVIDLKPKLKQLTLRIAAQCFLSLGKGSMSNSTHGLLEEFEKHFVTFNAGVFSIKNPFPFTAFGKAMEAREHIVSMIRKLLRESDSQDHRSMLQSVRNGKDDNGQPFSEEMICDQVLLVLWAGHDTSNASITCALLLLLDNPEWLQKCVEEQLAVAEAAGKSKDAQNLELSSDIFKQMPILEACIQETLRIYSPAVGVVKRTAGEIKVPDSQAVLPPDTMIFYSLLNSMNDPLAPGFDQNRWKFNPEQWLNPTQQLPSNIAFGWGIHACPGKLVALQEVKVILSQLLRTYKLEKVDRKPITRESMLFAPFPTTKESFLVKFTPRTK